MTRDELIRQADSSFETGIALFDRCDLVAAKEAFKIAYQIYRKNGNGGGKIFDTAFYLALCIVEAEKNHEELHEAEDLILRFVRDKDTIYGIPRIALLGRIYTLLGKTKLMHLVCNESIAMATTEEERGLALAGAVYAANPGKDAFRFASEALPLLRATGKHSEALAIVLEAMARAVNHLTLQERQLYANELLTLLKALHPHPMMLSISEAYMLLSYLKMEEAEWRDALEYAILALNYTGRDLEGAAIYMHISKINDMMDEPDEALKARYKALKMSVSFYGSDMLAYAKELSDVATQLAERCEYRFAVSAQLLSLRCLVDSDDPTYDQIRKSVIMLQEYERNLG